MIDFINGLLAEKESNYLVIDVSGIGFQVFIPSRLNLNIPPIGEKIKLYTHLIHKEDLMELYGFESMREREIFRHLMSVSGIGAKLAVKILSDLNYLDVIRAILNKDSVFLSTVKGLGKKTSEKVILELESKFNKIYLFPTPEKDGTSKNFDRTPIDALLALGYREKEAIEAVQAVIRKGKAQSTEEIVTESLKLLANI